MVQSAITSLLAAACVTYGGPHGQATAGTPGAPFARGYDHLPADLGDLPALCIGARSGDRPETLEDGEIITAPLQVEVITLTPSAENDTTGQWGGSAGASLALSTLFAEADTRGFTVRRWRQYETAWGGREAFLNSVILESTVAP